MCGQSDRESRGTNWEDCEVSEDPTVFSLSGDAHKPTEGYNKKSSRLHPSHDTRCQVKAHSYRPVTGSESQRQGGSGQCRARSLDLYKGSREASRPVCSLLPSAC